MDIQLKYGKETFFFNTPSNASILSYKEPEFAINKNDFQTNLENHLPLENDRYKDIAVVVSDKTRLCGYPEYLPWLTECLIKKGAKNENIRFYIAYGTHPRQTDQESLTCYGSVFNEYQFIHHDCNDLTLFEICGETRRGTPITLRKDILNSSLLITFGAISHHYFAAYGGGRKLLFPGLAYRKAIYHNHGLFLDKTNRSLSSACQPANLDGNPIAEDLEEIDSFVPNKISIHGIMNASGKVCRLMVGRSYEDFVEACRIHDSFYKLNTPAKYDLVIASSGGYPKDINFIQAHKSVHHAAAFVKDNGKLIILSECIDGIGSDYFLKYIQAGNFEKAFAILEEKYEGNGGTALSMMLKTKRINIYMHTALDAETCNLLGVKKADTSEIQNLIMSENGSMAIIQNASILIR